MCESARGLDCRETGRRRGKEGVERKGGRYGGKGREGDLKMRACGNYIMRGKGTRSLRHWNREPRSKNHCLTQEEINKMLEQSNRSQIMPPCQQETIAKQTLTPSLRYQTGPQGNAIFQNYHTKETKGWSLVPEKNRVSPHCCEGQSFWEHQVHGRCTDIHVSETLT